MEGIAHSPVGQLAAAARCNRRQKLLAASERLDSILKQHGQSLKISAEELSVLVGMPRMAGDLPELRFETLHECLRAIRRCRLYDLAYGFLRNTVRLSGPIDELVDVLYTINVSADMPQSLPEKFSLSTFILLKQWLPWLAKRFDSDFHYSLDPRAYELFLDKHLQYTCGRVLPDTTSIDEAQIEKFNLIAGWASEQLGTIKGKRHLDIGCGWGGLIAYFRDIYGTKSIGLTNCVRQQEYIASHHGGNTILGDYTNMSKLNIKFDLITVVGMSEHIVGGLKDQLLRCISRCLSDEGVLYFQSIQKPNAWIGGDAYRIAQEFIFPGHDLDTQREAEGRFVAAGFRIVHAEDHSVDYAYTTREWAKRVRANFIQMEGVIGTRNANLFLMYLFYASKLFKNGRGKLMRYALVK